MSPIKTPQKGQGPLASIFLRDKRQGRKGTRHPFSTCAPADLAESRSTICPRETLEMSYRGNPLQGGEGSVLRISRTGLSSLELSLPMTSKTLGLVIVANRSLVGIGIPVPSPTKAEVALSAAISHMGFFNYWRKMLDVIFLCTIMYDVRIYLLQSVCIFELKLDGARGSCVDW